MSNTDTVSLMASHLLGESWSPIRWRYDLTYERAAAEAYKLYKAVEAEIEKEVN